MAANCPPSTTFTIKDGTYKLSRAVNANSGDTFKGIYSDKTRPQIDANGSQIAFNVGDTKGVTISGLSISGTKGGEWCEPECGGAIKKDGWNLHVLNVRLHHNLNQGIGNPGPGFLLKNSEIDHNGSASFTNGGISSAAGIKITKGPATFKNNEVHHNYWHGIWCDGFAGSIVISGNAVHHNGKSGIRYEICRGPSSKITNNRVFGNGYLKKDNPGGSGRHSARRRPGRRGGGQHRQGEPRARHPGQNRRSPEDLWGEDPPQLLAQRLPEGLQARWRGVPGEWQVEVGTRDPRRSQTLNRA